jgi:hypothetical protein
VISAVFDAAGFDRAMATLVVRMGPRVEDGLSLTLESIANRARQTTTYVDRTSLLRNSTQSDGVTGSFSGELEGVVSFAARSKKGYLYGLAQEFGTRTGVREKRFIRDAIDAENGDLIESAMAEAFREAGFDVVGR